MLRTPHTWQERLVCVVAILLGVFVVVGDDVLTGCVVALVIWFLVKIRFVGIQSGEHVRKLRSIEQRVHTILFAIVVSKYLGRIRRFVFVDNDIGIGTDGKHQPS